MGLEKPIEPEIVDYGQGTEIWKGQIISSAIIYLAKVIAYYAEKFLQKEK